MKVKVDIDSLARSRRGAITGLLHCELDGTSFPDVEWNDFAVVVLGWWIRAWLSSSEGEVLFRFMDGPFWIRLNSSSTSPLHVVKFEAGDDKKSIVFGCAPCKEITTQLLHAAEAVLGKCGKYRWTSEDIDELKRGLDELRRSSVTTP